MLFDDDEDPREWTDAQVQERIDKFVAAMRAAAPNESDKGAPAATLRQEMDDLPWWTAERLRRGAAALLIHKMTTCSSKEVALWASVLESLLGIDWRIEENPL